MRGGWWCQLVPGGPGRGWARVPHTAAASSHPGPSPPPQGAMEPAPAPDTEEVELWSHTQLQAELVYRRGMATLQSFSESMAMEQRVEMYVLVLVAICLCILFKILNVNNSPEKSLFYCSNQQYLEEFLKRAPELAEPYIPTRFWGYSGHLQTIIQVSSVNK